MTVLERQFYYPNFMGRLIVLAMEEIIGREDVNNLFRLANLSAWVDEYPPADRDRHIPFDALSRLHTAQENLFGIPASSGLSLRIGKTAFTYGLRQLGGELGVTDTLFRLLPVNTKINQGIKIFAEVFNSTSDQQVRIENQGDKILWHIERCPICWARHTDKPACHLAVGVLQEALHWASPMKSYQVEETHCIACGDSACTIAITPITG